MYTPKNHTHWNKRFHRRSAIDLQYVLSILNTEPGVKIKLLSFHCRFFIHFKPHHELYGILLTSSQINVTVYVPSVWCLSLIIDTYNNNYIGIMSIMGDLTIGIYFIKRTVLSFSSENFQFAPLNFEQNI